MHSSTVDISCTAYVPSSYSVCWRGVEGDDRRARYGAVAWTRPGVASPCVPPTKSTVKPPIFAFHGGSYGSYAVDSNDVEAECSAFSTRSAASVGSATFE